MSNIFKSIHDNIIYESYTVKKRLNIEFLIPFFSFFDLYYMVQVKEEATLDDFHYVFINFYKFINLIRGVISEYKKDKLTIVYNVL